MCVCKIGAKRRSDVVLNLHLQAQGILPLIRPHRALNVRRSEQWNFAPSTSRMRMSCDLTHSKKNAT